MATEDITKYSLLAAVTCALLRGVTKNHILAVGIAVVGVLNGFTDGLARSIERALPGHWDPDATRSA